MPLNVPPQYPRRKLSKARNHVPPKVAACDSPDQVNQTRDDEEPSREKVQTPSPAVLIEDIVGARGTHYRVRCRGEHFRRCPTAVLVVAADRQLEERRREVVAGLAPVQPRMHHQNLEAREREREHTRREDPVRETDPASVARDGILAPLAGSHGCHCDPSRCMLPRKPRNPGEMIFLNRAGISALRVGAATDPRRPFTATGWRLTAAAAHAPPRNGRAQSILGSSRL